MGRRSGQSPHTEYVSALMARLLPLGVQYQKVPIRVGTFPQERKYTTSGLTYIIRPPQEPLPRSPTSRAPPPEPRLWSVPLRRWIAVLAPAPPPLPLSPPLLACPAAPTTKENEWFQKNLQIAFSKAKCMYLTSIPITKGRLPAVKWDKVFAGGDRNTSQARRSYQC